jgi:chorismate mutase
MSMEQLRGQIDEINMELVALLNRRAAVAEEIGRLKGCGPVQVPAREQTVLAQVAESNQGPLEPGDMIDIFRAIMGACCRVQERARPNLL